jgi:hypothetical protein
MGYLLALVGVGVGLEVWDVFEPTHKEKEKIVYVDSATGRVLHKKPERQPDDGEMPAVEKPNKDGVQKLATPAPPK